MTRTLCSEMVVNPKHRFVGTMLLRANVKCTEIRVFHRNKKIPHTIINSKYTSADTLRASPHKLRQPIHSHAISLKRTKNRIIFLKKRVQHSHSSNSYTHTHTDTIDSKQPSRVNSAVPVGVQSHWIALQCLLGEIGYLKRGRIKTTLKLWLFQHKSMAQLSSREIIRKLIELNSHSCHNNANNNKQNF